jgi:hypothetical protein
MYEQVPVLLAIFNRPEKTRKVVKALRKVKPPQLFVAADGPRPGHPEDVEKCRLARQVATDIDWPCDLQIRFLDKNVGCGMGISSAIGWFFEHVDYGVILEDDCVPHPHFFPFCSELFERYAEDERIMRISGLSPYPARNYPYDYHFSHRFHCWGWGTWRRAWKHFSYDMDLIDETEFLEMAKAFYPFQFQNSLELDKFRLSKKNMLKTWAFRWNVACFAQNGLCIIPEKNLIKNIGFGEEATHTKCSNPVMENLETHSLEFPLHHPPFVFADSRPGQSLDNANYRQRSFKGRCGQRLRHALGMLIDYTKTMPR